MAENGGKLTEAIRETGLYSQSVIDNPKKITDSKTWQELKEIYLPDELLGKKHQQLLNSTRIDHMIFPLGPKDEDDINLSGGRNKKKKEEPETEKDKHLKAERTTLTDKEIIQMLAEVNCKVRRIVHGETARHVYFWAADNRALKDGLDMAYKLAGKYAADQLPPQGNNTYNFLFNADAQKTVQAMNNVIKGLLTKPQNVSENKEDVPVVEERSEGA